MLILNRKVGETLLIGENPIEITILGLMGNQVRISVNAPNEVPIQRQENLHKKRRRHGGKSSGKK